jgi:hypothetical protein
VAFYSDKASVCRSNRPEPQGGDGVTQFGRAPSELDVDIICGNSAPPRAASSEPTRRGKTDSSKLRLWGISASRHRTHSPALVADDSGRFAEAPRNAFNAHRAAWPAEGPDDIFTWQETRKPSQSLSFNYQRQLFSVTEETPTGRG